MHCLSNRALRITLGIGLVAVIDKICLLRVCVADRFASGPRVDTVGPIPATIINAVFGCARYRMKCSASVGSASGPSGALVGALIRMQRPNQTQLYCRLAGPLGFTVDPTLLSWCAEAGAGDRR